MATNSLIGKERENGMVEYIYCHFDGDLEGVGDTLVDCYDSADLDELLKGGDLSSLDTTVDYCDFYRDRGEKDIDSRLVSKKCYIDGSDTNYFANYRYLYTKEGKYICYKGDPGKKPTIINL